MDKINQFHLKEIIKLVDSNNVFIQMINQNQAKHLISNGYADLELCYPVTVKFFLDIKNWKKFYIKKKSSRKFKVKFLNLDFRRSALYGNFIIQHPDGTEMFRCNYNKALWYLNRNKVDIIDAKSKILRLNFDPKGKAHYADPYYLMHKDNICTVCGCETELTRHHIVPYMYRKHFSEEIKSHNYHDVVLTCVWCHTKYEKNANILKNIIMKEHDIKIQRPTFLSTNAKVVSYASAILKHGDKIPSERKNFLISIIKEYTKKEDITTEDLMELIKIPVYEKIENCKEVGLIVIEETEDLQAFAERWRQHFITTMKPKFMPKLWNLNKPLLRID